MWFRIGIKGTEWSTYTEFPSEDKEKLLELWTVGAYQNLNEEWVDEMLLEAEEKETYPELCEIEMVKAPPKSYVDFHVSKIDQEIEALVELRNKLADSVS